jgi:CBS domain-containing protein
VRRGHRPARVVDERGRLVGIVSQGDLARHATRDPLPGEQHVLADVLGALSQPERPTQR